MSVSLAEVIEAGGYNLATAEHAQWLINKKSEFGELIESAENVIYEAEELEHKSHNRFDEEHRKTCDDCRDEYEDFCQEQAQDSELDELSGQEGGERL